MMKKLLGLLVLVLITQMSFAQLIPQKFGKGIQLIGKDSSFHIKAAFRFQNLFTNEWAVEDETGGSGGLENHSSNFLIRRARLKFDGFAYTPKLKYKFELGLSNRDIGNGGEEHNNAPKYILDAFITYTFYKNLAIRVGQGKLPGNRERVISSVNLQFVDRSRVNSRYNIDRDFGIQFLNHHKLGGDFIMKEKIAFTQGEGRNITDGNFGGNDFTFRLEFLPFGNFASKGDYVGSSVKRESKPKLAVGVTYDINKDAVKERGQNGSFIQDDEGLYFGKTLNTIFVDAMFKYQGFSFMLEYADKETEDDNPLVLDNEGHLIGTFYTGSGLNLTAGYMFDNNWELAFRYTTINPDEVVANNETEYTLGLSKFIVGHKLKVQTDVSYRDVTNKDDKFFWRVQMDIHF